MKSLPKHHSLLLVGLAQAYAAPQELALLASKTQPGLFPANALGKAAATEAQTAGWLHTKRSETKGKTTTTYVTITDAGCRYLMEQSDPKPLLEQVEEQLHRSEGQLRDLQLSLRSAHESIERLRHQVEQLAGNISQQQVTQTRVAVPVWEDGLTTYLQQRQNARPAEDCPLPELYQRARQLAPDLSVGSFHDGLRKLHAERRIALQPWTGPLHELPEPGLALLQGHSLAFYASV